MCPAPALELCGSRKRRKAAGCAQNCGALSPPGPGSPTLSPETGQEQGQSLQPEAAPPFYCSCPKDNGHSLRRAFVSGGGNWVGISGKTEWKLSLAVGSWRRKGNGEGTGQPEVRGSHQEAQGTSGSSQSPTVPDSLLVCNPGGQ